MHVLSIGFFTWHCNTVLNTLINSLDVKFYWFTTSGEENLFTISDRMNCTLSLASGKITLFYPKILPLSNYEEEW